jgi:hypothetical protein
MDFLVAVKECWEEDPKLVIKTFVAGALLGLAVPVLIIIAFAMM